MARVYLGIGSNLEPERHIRAAVAVMEAEFGPLALSPVFESEAVGFDGPRFLNLVAGLDTELPPDSLFARLRALEHRFGRPDNATKFSNRTLDIDILTWDDYCGSFAGGTLPRGEILQHAFVLWPLAELAGDARHPLDGRTYGELWADFAGPRNLRPVSFDFSPAGSDAAAGLI